MMTGSVASQPAYVSLVVRGPRGQEGHIEFVLDTGFTGFLALPPAACIRLGLPYLRPQPANLGGGNRVILQVYEATVLWDGVERAVRVVALEGHPLLGMTMLDGHDVRMQVREGGLVTIEAL